MLTLNLKSTLEEKAGLAPEKVEEVFKEAGEEGEKIDSMLVKRSIMNEVDMLKFFAELMQVEFRETLEATEIPPEFARHVPIKFAKSCNLIAFAEENGFVKVATARPMELDPLDEVAQMLGREIDVVFTPRQEITSAINRYYTRQAAADKEDQNYADLMVQDNEDDLDSLQTSQNILDDIDKAPVIRKVNSIMFNALKMRASDIHFQPYDYHLQVRYRVDGLLIDVEKIPKRVQELILTRIKVMGKMDIAERRMPQDGRATIRMGDSEIDLRISSLPTPNGERIVLRILDKTSKVFSLAEIGLRIEAQKTVNEYIHMPNGIILVTGPTGSGKTTTLYAALTRVNSPEQNIITVEDPIEYQLSGISQVEVNTKKGLTFAAGLRTIVRQDPDTIMVGEIRDGETAGIAIQSALTGHLVFSTLHTNDAAGSITRLVDLGVEPYLVASSLILVVAQRLIRLICEGCKEIYEPDEESLRIIGVDKSRVPGGKLWHGKGCDRCFGKGYSDRSGIYEIMPITEPIKSLTIQKRSAAEIKEHAVRHEGMVTLRVDAIDKMLAGITTPEEVLRVTHRDRV
ncbi:MAG: ATPase, T2SS/T4P/T4SS family [Planctomycetes bacterium]|nr:ATPase, T2SS/T4P/T4SS family [Planctomycetota bacterium]